MMVRVLDIRLARKDKEAPTIVTIALFNQILDSLKTLDNREDAESETISLKTSLEHFNSPRPVGNLLADQASTTESRKPSKEETQHDRLRHIQSHRTQQTEAEASPDHRLNLLLRALDRADEDAFWMGSRNERSNSSIRPPSPPPYDQPSMTFVTHESGSQDIYVGHGCTINVGQPTTVYAHSGCVVFAGYGSTIINESTTIPTAAEDGITAAPSETVRIKYGLEWADQEGWKEVRRHLPIEDLKSIPEIQDIKNNFAPAGIVNVSPAKSANSETRVAVKSNYEELMRGIREEWKVERERVIEETRKKIRQEEDQLYLRGATSDRIATMSEFRRFRVCSICAALGVEVKDQSHGRLVDLFQAQFRVEEFTDEDYDHLRSSSKRKDANDFAHLDPNTTEARIFRDILYDYLRKFGDAGELQRFQKYYKFAVGEYGLARR